MAGEFFHTEFNPGKSFCARLITPYFKRRQLNHACSLDIIAFLSGIMLTCNLEAKRPMPTDNHNLPMAISCKHQRNVPCDPSCKMTAAVV
jgi:hypothetical protein